MPRKSTTASSNRAAPSQSGTTMATPLGKVAGSRMSSVRHSGLLARDEELRATPSSSSSRRRGEEGEEDDGSVETGFELDISDEDERGFPSVSGKAIYSFRGRSRPSTAGGRTASATPQAKRSKVGSLDADGQPTSPVKRKKGKDKQEREVEEKEAEEMEVVESGKETGKISARRKELSSNSDDSEQSEDEDLRLMAARLNRGEAERLSEGLLEDYFTSHSNKSSLTSDHTLAKLAQPKMDQESVQSALSVTPSRFHKDCQLLYEEYRTMFPHWLFQLSNGYSLLLYGLGSKQKLLEEFRTTHLTGTAHLVVNGFFPGLTIKQVLTDLSASLLGYEGVSFKSTIEQAQFIAKELEKGTNSPKKSPRELFLVIHNIDGATLRGETAQTALSILAQSPSVHLLASIDHINAPLLWDQKKLSRFNWLWYDVTTYEPYRQETSYENSLLVQQSGSLALSSLQHVTESLTPNARGIFELLVRYQLDNRAENEGTYLGMSFHDCYLKCRERFLVTSDLTLRAQLTEFTDHKLVRGRRGRDGVEYLFIPIDDAALSQFLEQQAEEN